MLTFKNAPVAITANGRFVAANFSTAIGTAIAAAIAAGNIDLTGLEPHMEDDGNGTMVPVDGEYNIVDIDAFQNFLAANDSDYVVSVPPAPTQLNTSESKVWLIADKNKYRELTNKDVVKVTGEVLRFHVSMVGNNPVGLSLTLKTVQGIEVKSGVTALIPASYVKGITKKESTVANLLEWANANLKGLIVVLNSREAIAGETAYFRAQARFTETEKKAFAKQDKSLVMRNDDGDYGFLHRVSAINYTFNAIASETEVNDYKTLVASLASLKLKKIEKEMNSEIDNKNRDEVNRIDADAIEHHFATAKRMKDKGFLTDEQYNTRINELLTKFGMK